MMQTRDAREYSRAFRESAPASSMSAPRKILVTSALPNANGSIHLGHLLEHIQTDIWVRFQRLRGNQCIYVCADDTHGTATMLKAEQLGVPAEELIEQIRVEHESDFKRFFVAHDNFYSTHSEENRARSARPSTTVCSKAATYSRATWSSCSTRSASSSWLTGS